MKIMVVKRYYIEVVDDGGLAVARKMVEEKSVDQMDRLVQEIKDGLHD